MANPADWPDDADEFLAEIAPEVFAEYCQKLEADLDKCYRCALFKTYQSDQGHFDECQLFGTPQPLICYEGPYVTETSITKAG